MRLIDADCIKGIEQYIKTNENFEPYIMIDDLVRLLDEQPTAYDVDKVVQELKNESEFYNQCNYDLGQDFVPLYNAIEIVKGGGVDG